LDHGDWQVYTKPIKMSNQARTIQAKVQYLGKESNTTWLWMNEN
jgi:hypothetical protein